jgi:hypothetical protein
VIGVVTLALGAGFIIRGCGLRLSQLRLWILRRPTMSDVTLSEIEQLRAAAAADAVFEMEEDAFRARATAWRALWASVPHHGKPRRRRSCRKPTIDFSGPVFATRARRTGGTRSSALPRISPATVIGEPSRAIRRDPDDELPAASIPPRTPSGERISAARWRS